MGKKTKDGGEERVDSPKMAKKTKKEEGGGIKTSKTRKVGRGRDTPVVVEIHSSSSSSSGGGGAADDDASNGKESAASSTNNLPGKTRPGKGPKVAYLAGDSKVGGGEEEEEEEEGGRGGGDCYSTVRVRRVIKSEADWRTNQDALFLITAASVCSQSYPKFFSWFFLYLLLKSVWTDLLIVMQARFVQVLVKDAYAERKKVATIGYNHVGKINLSFTVESLLLVMLYA